MKNHCLAGSGVGINTLTSLYPPPSDFLSVFAISQNQLEIRMQGGLVQSRQRQ